MGHKNNNNQPTMAKAWAVPLGKIMRASGNNNEHLKCQAAKRMNARQQHKN